MGGGALQIGGHGDADDERHRVGFQLLANLHGHGGDHQNGGHVVHKGGNDPGEQGQGYGSPHDVGDLFHNQVRQQLRHFAFNKQGHQAHGPGDHQQNVEVNGAEDFVHRQHSCDDEDEGGA